MRSGRIVALLGLVAVSIGLPASPACAITIKGNIINMGEAAQYVDAESYLQLVAIPADGKMNFRVDGGRYTYESNLPQIKMPKAGAFSISAPGLKPGRYVILGQKLKGWGIDKRGGRFLARKGETKALEIEIRAGADTSTLDMGEVYIPVPASKYLSPPA